MAVHCEADIRARMAKLDYLIDAELDTGTNDPVQQWAALKTLHAMKVALEWALEEREVS